MNQQKNSDIMKSMFTTLWVSWATTFGALIMPIACSLFIKPLFIPFIIIAEIYILSALSRRSIKRGVSDLTLINRIAIWILVPSAIVMLALSILLTDFIIPRVYILPEYNMSIPYISSLVIFPITTIVCACSLIWRYFRRRSNEIHRIHNYYAGESLGGSILYNGARYQTSNLLMFSIVVGLIQYWYYFHRYINTDFNASDRFFFVIIPIAAFVISLFLMASRYSHMFVLYRTFEEARPDRNDTSRVRFLVFCENDLLLRIGDNDRWDTPFKTIIPRRASLSLEEAKQMFQELSGTSDFKLRYIFTSEDLAKNANTMHFAAFVGTEGSVEVSKNDDSWFNAYMLDCALRNSGLSPTLNNEIYRIHTITLAWKTYDRTGHRLYPIKHYRPTFRFNDLQNWDVDYDDLSWFDVAANNEDRRFFRLRKFWNLMTDVFDQAKNKA